MRTFELLVPCHFGLEAVLKREIYDLGYEITKVEDGRVTFEGDEEAICRANIFLRTAERVLIQVGRFKATTFEELFQGIKNLPWEEYIPEDGKFWVKKASSINSKLFSPSDIQSIAKKAMVERMKQKYRKDWFKEDGAPYPVRIFLLKDEVTVALDTSGDSLHKRGYRTMTSKALYVGSDLTEDGTTMFGRIEDLGTNDYNKLFNISPAGKHTAGEVYEGCYGFTYTFTHDSYRYTARRDDNGLGVCPDCDSTHEHTPYEEAGTNEKGVMVSATESLYGTDAVLSVDPYVDNGIEEAEITTVLLSEASTAREGVALLTSIYDNAGAAGGSGVFIADQNETWFVENLTGHTYLALKLSSSVVFMQPNIAAMGKIDLDDTDHVVASANLISVAQKAGTFVGDAAANVIDLDASYNGDIASDRMAAGLNYLYGTDTFTKDNYSETDFAISNVGENGAIVPVYSNIQLTKKFSVEDSIHFFQTEPIGKTGNVETHLFQVSATGDLNTAITEWTAFDDDVYNAFVPYYPMLTTDTADVYKVSVHKVTRSDEQPTEGVWYQDAKGRYYTYPDDWTDSFYGVRDALSNLLTYGSNGNRVTAKDQAAAKASYAALQQEIMADYADMKAAVAAADTLEAKQAAATNASNAMSQKVYNTTLKMYNKLQAKTAARAWVSSLLH